MCWNAQGIKSKLIEFFNYIGKNNINVALISETWLRQEHRMEHPGYKVYRKDRTDRKGGGVAIVVSNSLSHELLPAFDTKVVEAIGIKITGNQSPINIISAYFPGSRLTSDKLNNFKLDIRLLTSVRNSIIGGDFNAKHRSWNCVKANQAGKIMFDESCSKDFIVHFPPTPTFFPPQRCRTSPSTLDLFLINGISCIRRISALNSLSSDHLPVLIEIDISTKSNAVSQKIYCWQHANWTIFKDSLNKDLNISEVSPENLTMTHSIDLAITKLDESIKKATSDSVPLKELITKALLFPDNILKLISKRNMIRRQWQRSRCPYLKAELNVTNKSLKSKIFELRNNQWNKKISGFQKGSKHFWTATKLLTKPKNDIPPIKTTANKFLLTDQEKANEIAISFEKAHLTTFSYKSDANTEFLVSSSNRFLNFFKPSDDKIPLPNPSEVFKCIKFTKTKKSPGIDQILNIQLKHLSKKALIYLTQIYRACFRLSYFPSAWKVANVIAISKPGKDSSNAGNYRPISLLSSLSKIFEKLIANRLNSHIKAKNLLMNQQFGFRQGHSTSHQLLRVTKHIKKEFKKRRSTGMLTFDIEKAFDSVWHNALLYKLSKQKFPNYVIRLVQSFLKKRSFFVTVGNSKSPAKSIPAGVPQGSVLSPILFNLFITDLGETFETSGSAFFADDTAIFCSGTNPNKITEKLCKSADQLSKYCLKWKIKLNAAKTQAIFFTKKKSKDKLPGQTINLNGTPLPWSNNIKYLGLNLDKTLTFKFHSVKTVERFMKYMKILYPLISRKSKLSRDNKILIYKSIFQSILLYASPVWSNCAQCHINSLQLMQNKCLKLMLRLPIQFSTSKLHDLASIPLVKNQIAKNFENFNNKCRFSLNPLIQQLYHET